MPAAMATFSPNGLPRRGRAGLPPRVDEEAGPPVGPLARALLTSVGKVFGRLIASRR